MAYLDVLPLTTVKGYLRVDSDLTNDDTDITRMITSALQIIEQYTNHIAYARSESYIIKDGISRVYDYPINSVTSPETATELIKSNYSLFSVTTDSVVLTLNVGYAVNEFPKIFIEVALRIISYWYYGQDDQKIIGRIPESLLMELQANKRFLI